MQIESAILSEKFGLNKSTIKEHADFLRIILNNPVKIKRIFRASEFDFKASAFHEKCDNINDTLVLVRTEFGKTIGGFNRYQWSSPPKGEAFNDPNKRTFIFSLDMKEKFVPQGNKILHLQKDCGPIFGSGPPDIIILDQCHNHSNSMASFPTCYNREEENKLKKNKESFSLFSGATENANFKILEYEVFTVHYK